MYIRALTIAMTLLVAMGAPLAMAQDEPDFAGMFDEESEVDKADMEEVTGGDLKEFTVVTEDGIASLEVGDIYKNNQSFFKVVKIKSKGEDGGTFVVQRTAGTFDPMQKWSRVSGLGPTVLASRETLLRRFMSGGPLMYPIAFLLLCVVVICVNSIGVYRWKKHCPASFVSGVHEALGRGDLSGFKSLADSAKGLLPTICRAMLRNFDSSTEEDIRIRSVAEAKKQIGFLRIPLKALAMIAAIAPLLGILGTVVGMIACFDSLAGEAASAGKAQAMAAGIKIALLTTAAGLCVAVPAVVASFIFTTQLSSIVVGCEGEAAEIAHRLAGLKREAPAADAAAG